MGDADATTLFLVRHAAHDRVDRILCGRMPDVTLGEVGRRQAREVAQRLSREDLAAVYSSPLERALETASPIAEICGLATTASPGLNEIDAGEWTGRHFHELATDPRWRSWNAERADGEAPGGETMSAVQERVAVVLDRIRLSHRRGRVAAVSHCDVIKAALCRILGLSLDRYDAFDVSPASVSTVVLWEGGGKIVALNERCGP